MYKPQDPAPAITRLIKVLDDEKGALHVRDYIALADICEHKVRCLVELSSLLRTSPPEERDVHRRALDDVKQRLEDSEALLRTHIHAAGAVSAMIRDVIEEASSDGTYSQHSGRSFRR